MSEQLSPTFADSLRRELQHQMAEPSRRRRPARRTAISVAALLGIGLGGAGVAIATDLVRLPGSDIVVEVATSRMSTGVGSGAIELGDVPAGATHVATQFTCLSAGVFTLWSGVSLECSASAVGAPQASMFYRAPLPAGSEMAVLTEPESARWSAMTSLVTSETTAWGTNSKGESYGLQNDQGAPDLVAVMATNGRQGYVYADDLDGPVPSSPEEAIAWQEQRAGEVVTLPVYLLDGETQIGEFTLSPSVGESD